MICGKHLWQLCNIQSHHIRTSLKPWWSIMAPSRSQTSANWCSHPRGSAGSIKAWQRRHWKPLDATFLKSLPSFCPRDKQGSPFSALLEFCRHKLFGYLEVWQRSLPPLLEYLAFWCLPFNTHSVLYLKLVNVAPTGSQGILGGLGVATKQVPDSSKITGVLLVSCPVSATLRCVISTNCRSLHYLRSEYNWPFLEWVGAVVGLDDSVALGIPVTVKRVLHESWGSGNQVSQFYFSANPFSIYRSKTFPS